METYKVVRFTTWILNFMFFSGIVVIVTLPFSLKLAGMYYDEMIARRYIPMLVIMAAAGVLGVMIINQLRKMMKTVENGLCFVDNNVVSLRRMGIFSLCITVDFIVKMFVVPSFATCIIILVFFIAALFSRVLSLVFAEAVKVKEENDLTI